LVALVGQALGSTYIETQLRDDVRRPVWRGPVTIAVSNSFYDRPANIAPGSDVSGAIERSVQAWRSVVGFEIRLVESSRQDVSGVGVSGDGVSLLTIAPSAANTLFFVRNDNSPAKTRVFFSRRNSITEADIVLNPAAQFSTDGTFGTFDLEAVLTHEIGHLLGLRHSFVPGSIMYESVVRNGAMPKTNTVGSIAASDIAELRAMYGRNDDDCCGEIAGNAPSGVRKDSVYEIWAQNSVTGDVAASTTVSRGRSFRLAGLERGDYTVFAQARNSERSYEVRELGSFEVVPSTRTSVQLESSLGRKVDRIVALGVGGILADRFISLDAGTETQIMVAVEAGSIGPLKFELISPFLYADPDSTVEIDHADGIRTFLISVIVDKAAAKGNHSLCYVDALGTRSCVAGAIRIR